MVPSKPLQPEGNLRVEVGALPFRWLTEQGRRLYQHLLQTIAANPKNIDGESFDQFHDYVTGQEVPDYIQSDFKAKELYQDMIMLTEAILTDKSAGILADPRPNALESMKRWEDRLHKCAAKAEAQDRMIAHTAWRAWAIEASASGAGRAHKWTTLPQSWRPHTAKNAPRDHDAEPISILHELCQKFQRRWQPVSKPLLVPSRVLFPRVAA